MKKIIIFIICLLFVGCTVKNSFDDYYEFISYIDKFNFENIHGINYDLTLNEEKSSYFLNVSEGGIYNLHVDEYDSYYVNGINYIKNNDTKYKKKVLRNAYINLVKKYIHINFDTIELTGISKIIKNKNGYKIILNDAGILNYTNDILNRRDINIEKYKFISGNGYIEVVKNEENYYLESHINIKTVDKEYNIFEKINTKDFEDVYFDINEFE